MSVQGHQKQIIVYEASGEVGADTFQVLLSGHFAWHCQAHWSLYLATLTLLATLACWSLVHCHTDSARGTHLNGILTRPALIFLCSLERGLWEGGGLKVRQHLTMTKIVFVTFNCCGFTWREKYGRGCNQSWMGVQASFSAGSNH